MITRQGGKEGETNMRLNTDQRAVAGGKRRMAAYALTLGTLLWPRWRTTSTTSELEKFRHRHRRQRQRQSQRCQRCQRRQWKKLASDRARCQATWASLCGQFIRHHYVCLLAAYSSGTSAPKSRRLVPSRFFSGSLAA